MLRTDLWAAVFVRRHNDLGRMCVLMRRGDPIAGQILVEIDHLDGTMSLYVPAPAALREPGDADRVFQRRYDRVPPAKVAERIVREADFDPDFWLILLEMRDDDAGLTVIPA